MWLQNLNGCGEKTKAIVHKIMIGLFRIHNFSFFLLVTLASLLFNFHQGWNISSVAATESHSSYISSVMSRPICTYKERQVVTNLLNRTFGWFHFSYVYSSTFDSCEHSPHRCHKPKGLKHLLIWADGRWATTVPETRHRCFFVMSPWGNVNTRVFSRGIASWGSARLWWRYCLLALKWPQGHLQP